MRPPTHVTIPLLPACSTPVLATLLAYVSTSEGSAVEGASLLLLYSVGYVVPLLLAATFTVRAVVLVCEGRGSNARCIKKV